MPTSMEDEEVQYHGYVDGWSFLFLGKYVDGGRL